MMIMKGTWLESQLPMPSSVSLSVNKDSYSLSDIILSITISISFSFFSLYLYDVMQMRGEMQLIEKILQTEISLFRSIRDGTALMQHMEDFYYVTLLEVFYFYYPKKFYIYWHKFLWFMESYIKFMQKVKSKYAALGNIKSKKLEAW